MRPWYLGNTTVRSPFRLRDGLLALNDSYLGGKIKGRENENKFARVLHKSHVARIVREDADVSDLGRKWRAALSHLGFIYPEVPKKAGILQEEIGEPFRITPNGLRLIETNNVPGIQECFLRSLAAYYIPSVLEPHYKFSIFSPLRHTLSIMLEIEKRIGESRLNLLEMGLYVQCTSSDDNIKEIVDNILMFRERREASKNKRGFDQKALNAASKKHEYVATTFKDYADTNFRYLRATGIVQRKGKGIIFVPEKKVVIQQLIGQKDFPVNQKLLLINLCKGAMLPTDNRDNALVVLSDLIGQLSKRGIVYDLTGKSVDSPANIAMVRHDIESIISKKKEEDYSLQQPQKWEEIAAYMGLFINPKSRLINIDDEEISIPKAEAPAYFEWVLWRAFLAINNLINRPYEARMFNVDQDFLPIGNAPGNRPDLVFEFRDFVVVVEVTLTEGSRQEAAEGETVRRHIADAIDKYSKGNSVPVYGLFIAKKIDLNTAETFNRGVWYGKDGTKMNLNIVPLKLDIFKVFFEALFRSKNDQISVIRELLERCSSLRQSMDALKWKSEIEKTFQLRAASLGEYRGRTCIST